MNADRLGSVAAIRDAVLFCTPKKGSASKKREEFII